MAKTKTKKKKPGFGWQTYFVFVLFLNGQWVYNLFTPGTIVSNFYLIARAFHKPMMIFYILAIICLALNLLSLIPLYGFVFRVKVLSPMIWQVVFVLRVISDFCGHYYEFALLKSLFYDDLLLAISVLLASLLTVILSYIACFKYAFMQDKVIPPAQLEFQK